MGKEGDCYVRSPLPEVVQWVAMVAETISKKNLWAVFMRKNLTGTYLFQLSVFLHFATLT